MGRKVPVSREAVADEIMLQVEELNRTLSLATSLGIRVHLETAHMLRHREVVPLPVLRATVLNRRSR